MTEQLHKYGLGMYLIIIFIYIKFNIIYNYL